MAVLLALTRIMPIGCIPKQSQNVEIGTLGDLGKSWVQSGELLSDRMSVE